MDAIGSNRRENDGTTHGAWAAYDPRATLFRSTLVACALLATACGASPSGGGDDSGSDAVTPPTGDGGAAPNDSGKPSPDSGTPKDSGTPTPGKLTQGTNSLNLNVAGHARQVLVYAPAAVNNGPLPLVIALHGNGDTNTNFVASIGLQALADQDGFVIAAPQGITQSFTYLGQPLNGIDWDAYRPANGGNIDLPLLDAIAANLVATGSIDTKRIQSFGYSQGGYLSFRWGMDASATTACAAVIAAADPLPGMNLVSSAARKIPVAMQIGTNDWNISGARSTQTELQQNGNPLLYNEIQGAGHVPFPGLPHVPLDYCLGQSL